MKRQTICGSTAALIVVSMMALTAHSQEAADPDPFGGRLFPPNVILETQELGLTDAQRRQIREIVLATQATVSEGQWDMRDVYMQVMTELDASTIDEPAVMAMVQEVLQIENSVKLAQVSMLIGLRNLLTPEQLELLREAAK